MEKVIGLVYADSRDPGASFDQLDVEILESLVSHAALAIAMARVDHELRGLAARMPPHWNAVVAHHASKPGAPRDPA